MGELQAEGEALDEQRPLVSFADDRGTIDDGDIDWDTRKRRGSKALDESISCGAGV